METVTEREELLTAEADQLFAVLDRTLGQDREEVEGRLVDALREPSVRAVERYVANYHRAASTLAEHLYEPGDEEHRSSLWMLVDFAAAEAPLSQWVASHGPQGMWLELVARLRRDIEEASPLVEPHVPSEARRAWAEQFPDGSLAHFHRAVLWVLARRGDGRPLERIRATLDLSTTDLARLFGVSRQAAAKWVESGEAPANRQEKLAALVSVCDLLERKLKPGRLPGIARRPADDWDGLTLLEMVEQDRHRELLDSVRASFDWSAAA